MYYIYIKESFVMATTYEFLFNFVLCQDGWFSNVILDTFFCRSCLFPLDSFYLNFIHKFTIDENDENIDEIELN